MDMKKQFRRLSLELESQGDRVRNLLQGKHWQSDGEWKESVLRSVLRRHLPKNFEPVRGFVVGTESSTRQLDIILYDSAKPVLFRDGDFVVVTPDATIGIMEVKSSIRSLAELDSALETLSDNIATIRTQGGMSAFSGLFSFDTSLEGYDRLKAILGSLQKASAGRPERVVDIVALGKTVFVLYWEGASTLGESPRPRRWHAYNLPEMAPGYFVSNVVRSVAQESVLQNVGAWFPLSSEEELALVKEEDVGPGIAYYGEAKPGNL